MTIYPDVKKVPFLPDEKKWKWRPESQVLRNLGLTDDIHKQALRLVIEDVLAKNPEYSQYIGYHLFQQDRVQNPRFISSIHFNEEDSSERHHKPTRPIFIGYFMDSQVLTKKIITKEMVKDKAALLQENKIEAPVFQEPPSVESMSLLQKTSETRIVTKAPSISKKTIVPRRDFSEFHQRIGSLFSGEFFSKSDGELDHIKIAETGGLDIELVRRLFAKDGIINKQDVARLTEGALCYTLEQAGKGEESVSALRSLFREMRAGLHKPATSNRTAEMRFAN